MGAAWRGSGRTTSTRSKSGPTSSQLVGQYLTLKKAGHDSLTGLCPFHQEKTASFSVSPSKQVFYCFGCGKGGDAITFLRELEHLSYVEAIERLAQLAGVTLRFEGDSPAERRAAERRNALYRANEEAAALYRAMLRDGREAEDARAYVTERGITAEAIERFGIGYAPGYPDFLLRRLGGTCDLSPRCCSKRGWRPEATTATVRDRFRGRITFPIQDLQGRYIGFGARVVPARSTRGRAGQVPQHRGDADLPQAARSSTTSIARGQTVARPGEVFVVEGYTDVIGLAQAGIDNVVATCGTALGEKHFEQLSRFAQRAVLVVRLRRGGRAGGRASVRVPGEVPDHTPW